MNAAPLAFLSEQERTRVGFMQAVVRECADTPMVLKGGTGLLLAQGLPRYSEDLDFDSSVAINLEARLKRAAEDVGAEIQAIRLRKDTTTTRRYLVDFDQGNGPDTLKIEVSLRNQAIDEAAVAVVDGMRVYGLETLIDQKLHALTERTTARDLYDVHFLITQHAERFTRLQLDTLNTQVNDPDVLHSRFLPAHQRDPLVRHLPLDDLVLGLHLRTEQARAAQPAIALPAHLTADHLLKANGVRIINDQPRETFFDEKTQQLHAPPPNLPDVESYARSLIDRYARWRANQEPGLSDFEKMLYAQALVSTVGSQTGLFRAGIARTSNANVSEATKTAITPLAQRTVAAMLSRMQRAIPDDRYRDRDHDVSDDRGRERER